MLYSCGILAAVISQSRSSADSVVPAEESSFRLPLLSEFQLRALAPPTSCSALFSQTWRWLLDREKSLSERKHYCVFEALGRMNEVSVVLWTVRL